MRAKNPAVLAIPPRPLLPTLSSWGDEGTSPSHPGFMPGLGRCSRSLGPGKALSAGVFGVVGVPQAHTAGRELATRVAGTGVRTGSDLDEGHGAPGLCNAGAQLIHAVLHGAQDFGLLSLRVTSLRSTGSGRGHSPALGSQVLSRVVVGDPGVVSVPRRGWEWPRCRTVRQGVPQAQAGAIPKCQRGGQAGWLWGVCLSSLTCEQVQGHPCSSISLTFIWELP